MTEPKFYMVYVRGMSAPAKKHDVLADAMQEAQRLARSQIDSEVYVLEAVKRCQVVSVKWEDLA